MFADTIIASFLPTGAVSSLYYADRLYQLPVGVIGIAAGTVLLPEMSRRIAAGDVGRRARGAEPGGRLHARADAPFAVAFLAMPDLVMSALFQRGAFDAAAAQRAGAVLAAYAVGLPAVVLIRSAVASFYARADTTTPMIASLTAVGINVLFKIVLIRPFGVAGLALATAIGSLGQPRPARLARLPAGLDGAERYARQSAAGGYPGKRPPDRLCGLRGPISRAVRRPPWALARPRAFDAARIGRAPRLWGGARWSAQASRHSPRSILTALDHFSCIRIASAQRLRPCRRSLMPHDAARLADAEAFVFDAYGTLFDVHSAVAPPHGRRRPRRGAVVRTLADEAARIQLGAVAGRALRAVLDPDPARPRPRGRLLSERRSGREAAAPRRLSHARRLSGGRGRADPAAGAGAKTGILSNGDPGMLGERGGVGRPRRAAGRRSVHRRRAHLQDESRTYALVDSTFGTRTEKMVFVSSNRWDIAGAAAFGFRPVWVNRAGLPDEYPGLEPVAAVADLSVLA